MGIVSKGSTCDVEGCEEVAVRSLNTKKVQDAIANLTENKTTLVIAHRLSTIIKADKIIVLKQGKIVETGKHKDLLKNSIIYKNLYSRQLSAH